MQSDREKKIAALLSKDMQQLRILTLGLPPVKTYHTVINSGEYLDEKGQPILGEEIRKENHLFPAGYISTVVITHPTDTDLIGYFKDKNQNQPT